MSETRSSEDPCPLCDSIRVGALRNTLNRIFRVSSFSRWRSMSNILGSLLNTASSKLYSPCVTPITVTFLSREPEQRPSILETNSAITPHHVRVPPVSQVNIQAPNKECPIDEAGAGGGLRARENTALANLSPSPTY